MSEFPREALEEMAANYREAWPDQENFAERAIKAYDELAERCVMDAAAHRAEMGQLQERLDDETSAAYMRGIEEGRDTGYGEGWAAHDSAKEGP